MAQAKTKAKRRMTKIRNSLNFSAAYGLTFPIKKIEEPKLRIVIM